jgi:hypothetical protein
VRVRLRTILDDMLFFFHKQEKHMSKSTVVSKATRQELQRAAYYQVRSSQTGRSDSGARGNIRKEVETLGEALSIAKGSPYAIVSEFAEDGWLLREAYYSPRHPVSECQIFMARP